MIARSFSPRWSAAALGMILGLAAPISHARADAGHLEPIPDGADSAAEGAHAEPAHAKQVLLLHTVVLGEKTSKATAHDVERAERLDKILSDAVQDLGFTLDVSDASVDQAEELTDLELLSRVRGDEWVVYPSIDSGGSDMVVRIAAASRASKTVNVRTEVVKSSDLPVRAVVMLRDVVASKASEGSSAEARNADCGAAPNFVAPARSAGRAILAVNGAAFGAFIGYSLQRSSGSDDPRLLFPLMALGTGIGLGAAAIATEEWDVTVGMAWYLSAGAWWPALAGWYLARGSGEFARPAAYSTSVLAAFGGIGLATLAITLHGGMSEGGALLAHSGGAYGTVLGALAEFAVRGTTQGPTPAQGIGYGALSGVLLGGTMATLVEVEPSRVLAVDLGAGLGGLAGAAAASPFIFGDRTPAGDRTFLITTMTTTVAGGVLGWFLSKKAPAKSSLPGLMGFAGPIAPPSFARTPVPQVRDPIVFGAGITGALR